MTEANQLIMQALQQQWSLASPGVADIFWSSTRFETVDFDRAAKNFVVACYSPTGPSQTTPLTRELWLKTEQVIVDVLVKVVGTVDDAVAARENMRREVERIIHMSEFTISSLAEAVVAREPVQVEASNLVRVSVQVTCKSFQIREPV